MGIDYQRVCVCVCVLCVVCSACCILELEVLPDHGAEELQGADAERGSRTTLCITFVGKRQLPLITEHWKENAPSAPVCEPDDSPSNVERFSRKGCRHIRYGCTLRHHALAAAPPRQWPPHIGHRRKIVLAVRLK